MRTAPLSILSLSSLVAFAVAAQAQSGQDFQAWHGPKAGTSSPPQAVSGVQAFAPLPAYVLANVDDCGTADLQMGDGLYDYDLTGATTSALGQAEVFCNYFGFSNFDSDIWFTWQATVDGNANFDFCGMTTDTRIGVYVGADPAGTSCPNSAGVALLGCNDDACAFQSSLTVPVVAGQSYLVHIGTYPGQPAGAGTMTLVQTPTPCGYSIDGDSPNTDAIGLVQGGDVAYLNAFDSGAGDTIDQISVAFGATGGNLMPGNAAQIVLWDDPTNDGDPSDAVVLWSLNTTTSQENTGTLVDFAVPNIAVTGVFFAGAVVTHTAGEFPTAYDRTTNSFFRAWLVGQNAPGVLDINNLGGAGVAPTALDQLINSGLGTNGTFFVRAEGANNNCAVSPFTLFCDPAANNSSGGPVTLGNSDFSGPGLFHLEADGGPSGQFGYFLISALAVDPGIPVSQGFICVGAPQGRYNGVGGVSSIGQFNGSGVLQNIVGTSSVGSGFDVPASLPSPPGGVIVPGSTWNFQLWYRDGVNSNFSNGIAVTFP